MKVEIGQFLCVLRFRRGHITKLPVILEDVHTNFDKQWVVLACLVLLILGVYKLYTAIKKRNHVT